LDRIKSNLSKKGERPESADSGTERESWLLAGNEGGRGGVEKVAVDQYEQKEEKGKVDVSRR